MSDNSQENPPPTHPEFLQRLLPEYAAFYFAQRSKEPSGPPIYEYAWDPEFRKHPLIGLSMEPLEVGSVQDYELSKFKVVVYTPEGAAPAGGWPVVLWFPGGTSRAFVVL